MGISTIGQIAQLPEPELNRRLGKWGNALWRLANGMDARPVVTSTPRKSISQERTFDTDTDNEELIERTLFQLADALTRLMRNKHLKGRTVTLKIRLECFSTLTRSQSLSDFVDSAQVLKGIVIDQFRKFDRKNMKVRLIGIAISQLNSVSGEQLGLFEQEAPLNQKVTKLLDSLNDKYGDEVVKHATFADK